MSTAAIISIIISIIVPILGGVWFIVQKAFKIGKYTHRLDEIEKKVCNAQCDVNNRGIMELGDDMKTIKNDIVAIKSLLIMKHKNAADIFSMKSSPRRLNELGEKIFVEIKGNDFLSANKDFLFKKIDENHPHTALDVENAANIACSAYTNESIFNELKNYVYNSPSITIQRDGEDKLYDISLGDVCFVLSLPLRDMYLKEHPEISTE